MPVKYTDLPSNSKPQYTDLPSAGNSQYTDLPSASPADALADSPKPSPGNSNDATWQAHEPTWGERIKKTFFNTSLGDAVNRLPQSVQHVLPSWMHSGLNPQSEDAERQHQQLLSFEELSQGLNRNNPADAPSRTEKFARGVGKVASGATTPGMLLTAATAGPLVGAAGGLIPEIAPYIPSGVATAFTGLGLKSLWEAGDQGVDLHNQKVQHEEAAKEALAEGYTDLAAGHLKAINQIAQAQWELAGTATGAGVMTALGAHGMVPEKPFIGPRLDPLDASNWRGIIPKYLRQQMAGGNHEPTQATAARPWGDLEKGPWPDTPWSAPFLSRKVEKTVSPTPEQLQLPFSGNSNPQPAQRSFDFGQLPVQTPNEPTIHADADANGQLRLFPQQPHQLELQAQEPVPQRPEGPSAQTAFEFPQNPWQMSFDFNQKPSVAWSKENPFFTEEEYTKWQSKKIPPTPEAPVPEKPVEAPASTEPTTHQAENPSVTTPTPEAPKPVKPAPKKAAAPEGVAPTSPVPLRQKASLAMAKTLETGFRPVIQTIIRMAQLSKAATDRLNVERALKQIVGTPLTKDEVDEYTKAGITPDPDSWKNENPLVGSKSPYENLGDSDRGVIDSVAKALKISPKELEHNNWRLTDEQVQRLREMRSEGINPKGKGAPKDPLGEAVHHPLAIINSANARAAGLPNPDYLWSQAHPDDQAENLSRKAEREAQSQSETGALSSLYEYANDNATTGTRRTHEGLAILGREDAVGGGEVTSGKDLEDLEFRHDAMQRILQARIAQGVAHLEQHIPRWEAARGKTTKPSGLSEEIAALPPELQAVLPKELYDPKHSGAPSSEAPKAPNLQESLQGTSTTPESPTSKAPANTRITTGQTPDPYLAKIKQLAAQMREAHGNEVFGSLPKMAQAIAAKYKDPELASKYMFKALSKYDELLKAGDETALTRVLNAIRKLPGDAEVQNTLYSNPIGAIFDRFMKANKPASGVEDLGLDSGILPTSAVERLTDKLRGDTTGVASHLNDWVQNEALKAMRRIEELPASLEVQRQLMKDSFKAVIDSYKNREGPDPWELMKSVRQLTLLQKGAALAALDKKLQATVPDMLRQAGISAWIEAHRGPEGPLLEGQTSNRLGDDAALARLQEQLDFLSQKKTLLGKDRYVTKVFKTAMNLTPEEKTLSEEINRYDRELVEEEREAGLEHAVQQEYLQHVWKMEGPLVAAFKGMRGASGFATSDNFMKMRQKLTYFEGLQAGLNPVDMSARFLITNRANASARVIANRNFVENLQRIVMPDGKPMVAIRGTGFNVEPAVEGAKGAILIKPGLPKSAQSAAGEPYRAINHPAFRDWKWLATAPDGTPVMGLEDMVVHPDAYSHVQSEFTESAWRSNPFLRAVMTTSAGVKHNLLTYSIFHPKALFEHGLQHVGLGAMTGTLSQEAKSSLNPFTKRQIVDLNQPKQQFAILTGLNLNAFSPESMEMEGVAGLSKLPYVGGLWRPVHDLMWKQYIPNLAMGTWLDAYERNLNRYHEEYKNEELGKMGYDDPDTASQEAHGMASQQAQWRIGKMTSDQTNYSYGLLPLEKVPGLRSKTVQDTARLILLAPTFLASRGALLLDAVRPGGSESRQAATLGALTTWLLCRTLNAAFNDGDSKDDIYEWNKVVIGHHEYNFRSETSDAIDAFIDSRRFVEHRLNPLARPLLEEWTKRDIYQHPVMQTQIAVDTLKTNSPIPLQGLVDQFGPHFNKALRSSEEGESTLDSLMSGLGVQRRKYRTPAERMVFKDFDNIQASPTDDELAMEQKNTFLNLRQQFQDGKLTPKDITAAINDPKGNLKLSEAKYLFKTAQKTQLVNRAQHLEYGQVHKAWDKASPSEKLELAPVLLSKIRALAPPLQRDAYAELREFTQSLSPEMRAKYISEAQEQLKWESRK